MTTFAFPSITPSSADFKLVANQIANKSALSGAIQTVSRPGTLWQVSASFNSLSAANRATMMGFLAQLYGQQHRFTMQAWGAPQLGILTGTPVMQGGGQTGTQIETDGWTTSQTGIVKAGDFISVGGELKMVTADANSNGSGEATLYIAPELRVAPADNATITVSSPTGIFMLAQNDGAGWSNRPGILSNFQIVAIEDIAA